MSKRSEAKRSAPKRFGKVKWYNPAKGMGFITTEDGEDVYVHVSALEGEAFRDLKAGDPVEFDMMPGKRGPQAERVTRASGVPRV